jgi:hypothetical protein
VADEQMREQTAPVEASAPASDPSKASGAPAVVSVAFTRLGPIAPDAA